MSETGLATKLSRFKDIRFKKNEPVEGERVGWTLEDYPASMRRASIFRNIAVGAGVLALGIGLGVAVGSGDGGSATAAMEIPDTLGVDTAGAAGVADYTARSWLTLTDSRTEDLARVGLPGSGWSGKGSLTVDRSYVAATHVVNKSTVNVTVAVELVSSTEKGPVGLAPDPAAEQVESRVGWVGVEVPVTVTTAGSQVGGTPKIVGLPDVVSVKDAPSTEREDPAFTEQTQKDVEAFFTAWATGTTESVTAPGSTIPALPKGLGEVTVTSWTAFVGNGETRNGIATVQLQMAEASFVSTFEVELERVSSSTGESRWQVTSLK